MIGAGFNLLVNRAEDEGEDAVDPLDWLNCAADKLANVAEDEAVMMHLRHCYDNINVYSSNIHPKIHMVQIFQGGFSP